MNQVTKYDFKNMELYVARIILQTFNIFLYFMAEKAREDLSSNKKTDANLMEGKGSQNIWTTILEELEQLAKINWMMVL